jgi:hypothetical protein
LGQFRDFIAFHIRYIARFPFSHGAFGHTDVLPHLLKRHAELGAAGFYQFADCHHKFLPSKRRFGTGRPRSFSKRVSGNSRFVFATLTAVTMETLRFRQ